MIQKINQTLIREMSFRSIPQQAKLTENHPRMDALLEEMVKVIQQSDQGQQQQPGPSTSPTSSQSSVIKQEPNQQQPQQQQQQDE